MECRISPGKCAGDAAQRTLKGEGLEGVSMSKRLRSLGWLLSKRMNSRHLVTLANSAPGIFTWQQMHLSDFEAVDDSPMKAFFLHMP